ncbi:DUF4189 domain-containing protein [Oryzibacter oryziterrae]|uniref:DUF4189 domain-containing protein n=1 Tax=Oryzibacter oryziterrae TaxID=2766474 RepID=UPI001F20D921|nr:DUF4189 domain-containing protein [Oryzibacter oryziterrae]
MKNFAKLSVVTAFAIAVSTGSVLAGDTKWGAFAVDTSDATTNTPYYGVGGGDTEKEASDNAVKFCAEEGGKNCTLATTYEQCGALASNGSSIGWGNAPTQEEAEKQSMVGCGKDDCKVLASDCN